MIEKAIWTHFTVIYRLIVFARNTLALLLVYVLQWKPCLGPVAFQSLLKVCNSYPGISELVFSLRSWGHGDFNFFWPYDRGSCNGSSFLRQLIGLWFFIGLRIIVKYQAMSKSHFSRHGFQSGQGLWIFSSVAWSCTFHMVCVWRMPALMGYPNWLLHLNWTVT